MEYWWDCLDGYTHSKLYEKMTSGTRSSLKCLYICNEVGLSSLRFDFISLGNFIILGWIETTLHAKWNILYIHEICFTSQFSKELFFSFFENGRRLKKLAWLLDTLSFYHIQNWPIRFSFYYQSKLHILLALQSTLSCLCMQNVLWKQSCLFFPLENNV